MANKDDLKSKLTDILNEAEPLQNQHSLNDAKNFRKITNIHGRWVLNIGDGNLKTLIVIAFLLLCIHLFSFLSSHYEQKQVIDMSAKSVERSISLHESNQLKQLIKKVSVCEGYKNTSKITSEVKAHFNVYSLERIPVSMFRQINEYLDNRQCDIEL